MPYLGISPAPYGSPETFEDVFTGPFSTPQNVFTLTKDVTGEADIIVSINGVIQHGGSYEISGTGNRTLTLDNNCVLNDELRVLHLGFKAVSINVINLKSLKEYSIIKSNISFKYIDNLNEFVECLDDAFNGKEKLSVIIGETKGGELKISIISKQKYAKFTFLQTKKLAAEHREQCPVPNSYY